MRNLQVVLKILLKIGIVLWLVLSIFKLIFILSYTDQFHFSLYIKAIIVGLKFDLGIILCILFVTFCLLIISSKIESKRFKLMAVVVYFIIFFSIFLTQLIDFFLYKYWACIFNIRAANYINNVFGIIGNMSKFQLAISLVILVGFSLFISSSLTYKLVMPFYAKSIVIKNKFIYLFIFILASIYTLRGGLREIPLNQSDAHFSIHKVYNLSAINSLWNFLSVFINHSHYLQTNPYRKFPDKIVTKVVADEFANRSNHSIELFTNFNNISIVIITMEGVNAQLFKTHNQSESYMPNLERLIDSGYYFTKCFASGFRTEQGLTAMLSGMLSTPHSNLTDDVSRIYSIPSIVSSFKSRNYQSKFIFGGDIEFANMKTYLNVIGFDKVFSLDDFEKKYRTQSLGVNDEVLFDRAFVEYSKGSQPLFMQIMTQSTHEPYDIPVNLTVNDEELKYKNSAKFLDNAIFKFIEKCRQLPRFQKTIFIITSDHAHKYPGNIDIAHPNRYHIPILIYSPCLNKKYIGYKDSLLFNQVNFPATLSYLLHFKETNYMQFSRNHFSHSKRSSFSSFVEGYVFQEDSLLLTHEYIWGKNNFKDKNLLKQHEVPLSIMQYVTDQAIGVRPIKEK